VRRYGHVVCEDDAAWVKCGMKTEVDIPTQMGGRLGRHAVKVDVKFLTSKSKRFTQHCDTDAGLQ